MKVLLISHTCQSRTEGQPKARALSRYADVKLQVLTPQLWKHYGKWRAAEPAVDGDFALLQERVRWAWMGPAQFYLHWYPRLARIMVDFAPDVIDLWEEPWGLVSVHACWLRNRLLPNARIISETEQNIDKKLPPPFESFRSYVLRNADHAIGRSEQAVSVLREKGFKGPADVVPNAVDAELFRPLDRRDCRAKLQVDGFVVGYVGRLVPEKGIDDLLDALGECSESVQLLLVGESPDPERWKQRIAALKLESRVRLIGGRPASELPAIINALDVLVLPSRTTASWKEQFGRVVIEAHACGIPVIGSDSGAIPSVVGAAGIIFPERNPHELANAIKSLAGDADHCAELGLIGRKQVEELYTWDRVAERMHEIYLRCVRDSQSSHQVASAEVVRA